MIFHRKYFVVLQCIYLYIYTEWTSLWSTRLFGRVRKHQFRISSFTPPTICGFQDGRINQKAVYSQWGIRGKIITTIPISPNKFLSHFPITMGKYIIAMDNDWWTKIHQAFNQFKSFCFKSVSVEERSNQWISHVEGESSGLAILDGEQHRPRFLLVC